MICERICINNQTNTTFIEASKNEKKEGKDEREEEKTDEKKKK
jgi:DsbC/DsbD-like thiol-disulfide interchange protein